MKKSEELVVRNDLKEKLDKAVAELKTNCKDAHFFDKQMDMILSLKGQMDVEPVRLIVKEADVVKEYKGDTFYIAVTKQGAMYHTYGGYTVFIKQFPSGSIYPNSLYTVLNDIVDKMHAENEKPLIGEEMDEMVFADMMLKQHIINAPTWCFTDADATVSIGSSVMDNIVRLTEKALDSVLQEEDFQANADFEAAVMGAEQIGEAIREEKKKQ